MSDFELNIQFRSEDVRLIQQADQKVTLLKEVAGSSGQPVTWVTFNPFEGNTVNWTLDFGLYASNTLIQNGATIDKRSTVDPASSGVLYPFADGTFDNPTGDAGVNNYGIQNHYDTAQQLTFGVAQSVTANGTAFEANPLNAVPVLFNQEAIFTPIEKVTIFLQGKFDNGVILTEVQGGALTVDLTNNPSQAVHYDAAKGKFLAGPLP